MNYHKKVSGLHLLTPKSDTEIIQMAEIYARHNPIGMIPVDINRCLIASRNIINSSGYLRMIMVDEVIHGFVVGTIASSFHFSEKTVQQVYCFSDLNGMLAFRSIIVAHEGLIKYAESVKAKYVMSASNPFIENNNFNKILELDGWSTFGGMSLWRTSHHKEPSKSKRLRKRKE